MSNQVIACAALLVAAILPGHDASAQCAVTVQPTITSGWGKQNVSYSVEGNRLKIRAGGGAINDADSIYIGSARGCSTITIHVTQISGDFPWGGKAIGFAFSSDRLAPAQWGNQASFPPPRGRAMEAGFIKARLLENTELVYDIKNSADTIHIGAKVFIGNNVSLEIRFGPQAEPGSARSASRAPKPENISVPRRETVSAVPQSVGPAMSCSGDCREPRPRYDLPAFSRAYSFSAGAACRDGGDEMAEYLQ